MSITNSKEDQPSRRNESTHSNDDIANEALAAEARQRGTDIIRDHLSNHLQNNPDSSYVTWISTLHPENAEVTIDERFFIPNNPWWTVYEEGKDTLTTAAIVEPTISPTEPEASSSSSSQNMEIGERYNGGFIDTIIGFAFEVSSIFAAIGLEIGALLVYLVAVGCHWICAMLSDPNITCASFLPYALFFLLLQIFRLLDCILLTLSVFLTELLAFLAWLLCSLFSCSFAVGYTWHQNIRKISHHTRWAFRVKFEGWEPSRSPLYGGEENDKNDNDTCGQQDYATPPTAIDEGDIIDLGDQSIAIADVVLVDGSKV